MIDLGTWLTIRYRGNWSTIKAWNVYEWGKFIEKLQMAIAWKIPIWLVHWSIVRAAIMVEPQNFPGYVTSQQMLKATMPKWWKKYMSERQTEDDV